MTAPPHLTDEQVARFHDRTLPPAELLTLDGHLARCAACRDRLYAEQHVSNRIRAIRAEVSGHLEYDRIVKCSEGSAGPEERAHLRDCPMCRAEVQDLSRFRTELHDTPRVSRKAPVVSISGWKKWRTPAAVAAAVVVIAGGAVWTKQGQRKPQEIAAARPEQTEAPLPGAERALLGRALASKRLERAPVLDHLIARPGALLGPGPERVELQLLSPVGTTVVRDRPLLRWTPVAGATHYVVSIFDERFEKVAESAALTGTDWEPASALPRNRVLLWQVTATTPSGTVRAPRPPAPEARFEVVPAEVAAHIASIRRQHPGNALLLAALYAQAGALDDANQELNAMDRAAAERYRESLAKIRNPE